MQIRTSLGTKFQLKLKILFFRSKFAPKWSFWSKKEKVSIAIIRISLGTKFQLKLTIFVFWTKFVPKKVFSVENRQSEHHHWLLHIQTSIGIKVQLKVTILTFWTKFTQKGCFWSKTEKVNFTIEFCIFELVWVPSFSLDEQGCFRSNTESSRLCVCPWSFLTILNFFARGHNVISNKTRQRRVRRLLMRIKARKVHKASINDG